jgi:hypothetical protein
MKKRSQKLLGRMREAIRLNYYSIHTEEARVAWSKSHRQEQSRTPWTSAQGVLKNVLYNS